MLYKSIAIAGFTYDVKWPELGLVMKYMTSMAQVFKKSILWGWGDHILFDPTQIWQIFLASSAEELNERV